MRETTTKIAVTAESPERDQLNPRLVTLRAVALKITIGSLFAPSLCRTASRKRMASASDCDPHRIINAGKSELRCLPSALTLVNLVSLHWMKRGLRE